MIKSMTAYAAAHNRTELIDISVEIRSYNSRHLDIDLHIPKRLKDLEKNIKDLVAENMTRGRVELWLKVIDTAEDAYAFEINEPKAKAFYAAMDALKAKFDLDDVVTLELLISAGDIIKPVDMTDDLDAKWPSVQICLTNALDKLNEMRKEEGAFLAKDLKARIDDIEKRMDVIEQSSENLVVQYQERLKERIAVLTKDAVAVDPVRIAQEAAFLADRSDISEEIVRAKSHIKQFRSIMDANEPSGKKLNFLLQEFNREFNTMGSKIGKADIAHVIVDVKSELEKIREQVQNIE